MDTMKPSSSPIAPWIPLLAGMIAISFAPILVRYSDAPVSVQGMYRMLFTFALMLPFGAKSVREARAVSRKDWLLLAAASFFLALHFLLWMASLNYTSIASSTIILTLEPVFVMIGAYLAFREKSNRLAVIGIGIALLGVAVVSSGDIGVSRDALFGDFLSFTGMLAVVANMLIAKRLLTRISSYFYSLVVFGVAAIFFALYNIAEGLPMVGYPAKEWGIFLLLAVVPTVLGHLIFNWLLQYVKTTTISIAVLAEPVGASLLGMMLFGEMVTSSQYAGGALVIAGLIFYLRHERDAKK